MPTATANWSAPKDTKFYRRKLYLRHLLVTALFIRSGYPLRTLGTKETGCSWKLCPEGLDHNSVVYSGGVGFDITFEHALVEQYGCLVNLFDPSPSGLRTMNLPENKIPRFRFFPVGLAGECGTLRFAPPLFPEEGSWFANAGAGTIEVPCQDLTTLLKANGHDHIDLLKLDIEGAEYGVIDHLLAKRIPVRQILVEFHHDLLPGIRLRQGVRATYKLMRQGYKLIAEVGNSYTFIR